MDIFTQLTYLSLTNSNLLFISIDQKGLAHLINNACRNNFAKELMFSHV